MFSKDDLMDVWIMKWFPHSRWRIHPSRHVITLFCVGWEHPRATLSANSKDTTQILAIIAMLGSRSPEHVPLMTCWYRFTCYFSRPDCSHLISFFRSLNATSKIGMNSTKVFGWSPPYEKLDLFIRVCSIIKHQFNTFCFINEECYTEYIPTVVLKIKHLFYSTVNISLFAWLQMHLLCIEESKHYIFLKPCNSLKILFLNI